MMFVFWFFSEVPNTITGYQKLLSPANCWKMNVVSYLVSLTLCEIGSAKEFGSDEKSLEKV